MYVSKRKECEEILERKAKCRLDRMLSKHITIIYELDGRGPLYGSNYIKPLIAPLWSGNLCNVRRGRRRFIVLSFCLSMYSDRT
jgi:hypothetical protein